MESFGQTVTASLACGTPVIGFNTGGIPDMVRPGVTGYLAETGNAASLRDAIAKAFADSNWQQLSNNSRAIAVNEYTLGVQASTYLQLYKKLTDKP
jgi:glycosyltransferase involved in cell wall biosynthesis